MELAKINDNIFKNIIDSLYVYLIKFSQRLI